MHSRYINKYQSEKHRRRRGFVLVMALALIVLATISLAGLARRNLKLVSQVSREQEKLQRKWGIISCQSVLLDNSKDILNKQINNIPPEKIRWPLPSSISSHFMLGKLQFEIHLADEDAKVNLNKVYRLSSSDAEKRNLQMVRKVISSLEDSSESSQLITRLQYPVGVDKSKIHSPFQSWGQIFEKTDSGSFHDTARQFFLKTKELSCWGNGRLNLRRASDEAIRSIGQLRSAKNSLNFKTLQELLVLRKQQGIRNFDQLLSILKPKGKDRLLLRQFFTDRSSCQSLWILIKGHHRESGSLSVNQPGQISGGKRISYLW